MRCEEIIVDAGGEKARLCTYLWDNSEELYDGLKRPLILICPGGAYCKTSDREAEGVAVCYVSMGFHAAVLRYSVAPAVYPTALLQLAAAVLLVRERAKEWYVDPHKIVVNGFSAGGHLAACLGVFWKEALIREALHVTPDQVKPDALILCYPVITSGKYAHAESFRNLLGDDYDRLAGRMSLEKQVNEDMPAVFLWHTYTDESVPVENSLLLVQALREHRVPVEFHMYAVGAHGLGTAGALTGSRDGRGIQRECESWMELAHVWLENFL